MPETDKYYDPLRRKWVAATPEERVRQWFIGQLSGAGQVPTWLMMSEVSMKFGQKSWRADIVVYDSQGRPLAVVECKRPDVTIDGAVAEQALRYTAVQNVRYIFLTNGTSTYVYRRADDGFEPMKHFPNYLEMSKSCPQ
jgi:type I site-specific restriction endonuclease